MEAKSGCSETLREAFLLFFFSFHSFAIRPRAAAGLGLNHCKWDLERASRTRRSMTTRFHTGAGDPPKL